MKKAKASRSLYENIQILAMASVANPDHEYLERRAKRDFAVLFHVSLLDTDDIPMSVILQHLYEYQYERMTIAERAEAATKLQMTPEERLAAMEAIWNNEAENDVFLFQEIQKIKKEKPKAKPSGIDPISGLPPDGALDFD